MSDDWIIEDGQLGPRMVMTSAWSPAALEATLANDVRELELNYAKGWSGHDYSFLDGLRALEALELTDWNATGVAPVNRLVSLRRLKVFTYCKTEIDFSRLPRLEDCSLEWRAKASSLFEHTGIKKLFINKYPGKDMVAFARMDLQSLSLASPRVESLRGIERSAKLTSFELHAARRLGSIEGVERLLGLTRLAVNDCPKVMHIGPVAQLRALRELELCNDGEIDSVKPLAALKELRVFLFTESTVIRDGDLGVLAELPRLEHVAFADRNHYSNRTSDFPRRRIS